ncbi:MAG TPA: NAD(P)/FAD-dependent oxidoreductase [Oleiagrimonas sp.]|nr:NAD(P)/FAD-dependent oxidoreductase [Oleiagrimonas sp.]
MNASSLPVVVIGAGLAGLSAAVRLGRMGYRVVILEAGSGIGGCCSTETVDGFRFNNGAIYVATPSLLRHAFTRLGLDLDEQVRMHAIEVPQLSVLDNGTRVFTTTTQGSWVEGERADERTRRYRSELDHLYRTWRPIYRTLMDEVLPHELSMWRVLSRLWRHLPKMSGSVADLLRKNFSDPDARAAAGAITLYTGLAPQDTPAAQIVGLMALLDEGFWLPEGGMGRIPEALGHAAVAQGVDIRLQAVVDRIAIRHGAVEGVHLADGKFVPARAVIATNSAVQTVKDMLDPGIVPKSLARRAQKSPLSHRAISIQLGVQWEEPATARAFAVNHVPSLEKQGLFHLPAEGTVRWFSWTCPTGIVPGTAPEGMAVVEMFAPVPAGNADAVDTDETRDIAERYMAAWHREQPCRIVARRILSPRDFAIQRHLYKGALYGLSPGVKPTAYFPHRSGITGLYLAGQTTYPGYGVAPAMLSGIHAADALRAK